MPGRSSSRTCFAVRGNAESVRIPHGSPVGPTPFSGSARTSFHTCATTERVSTGHNEVRERSLPREWTAQVLHDNVTWSMWRLRKRSSLARLKGSAPFLLLPFFALWFGTLPMIKFDVKITQSHVHFFFFFLLLVALWRRNRRSCGSCCSKTIWFWLRHFVFQYTSYILCRTGSR
jgi:hypothetical protein